MLDKSADVVDAIHDTTKMVDNAEDTLDTICDVSKKTDFLIVGENAGSKKQKAENLGVTVLTEQDLIGVLNSIL